jgi:hypothetical protein
MIPEKKAAASDARVISVDVARIDSAPRIIRNGNFNREGRNNEEGKSAF